MLLLLAIRVRQKNLIFKMRTQENRNTEIFINHINSQRVCDGHQFLLFDIKSFFTKVPLNETIDIIFKKIYDENKVVTNITRLTLKTLLYLCTKHVHFKSNDEIYIQCDGVAMGSPLGHHL